MNAISIYRALAFAGKSFWRNIWLSLVTISIITLMLLSVNALIVLNVISAKSIEVVEQRIDVSVYFKPEVTEQQVQEVRTYLNGVAQVEGIEFISQGAALAAFRERHADDPDIIDALAELDGNPLGATLRVRAQELGDYPAIIEVLDASQYDDLILEKNFNNRQTFIERIGRLTDNLELLGVTTIIVFAVIAALIVFNTIRVAIYTQRESVTIMRLVGAANWFIRAPFILESIFYGLIALGITVAIVFPALRAVQPRLASFLLLENFSIVGHFVSDAWRIFGAQVIGIILLTVLSSAVALRRYLRA